MAAPPPPPGIFRPSGPHHSIATLVLIENSEEMYPRWNDLRDQYLPTLLGTMRMINPVVPIQVLWLTSCPAPTSGEMSSTPQNSSRQFNQLPELRFNPQPNNRISLGTLHRGIDLLASTYQKVPTTRHLFVVAASSPSDDVDSPSPISGTSETRSAWKFLAEKLHREDIHLHMILNPKSDTTVFVDLYYETLRLQERQESPLWFKVDHQKYFLYLSRDTEDDGVIGVPGQSMDLITSQNVQPCAANPDYYSSGPPRIPLPRNNSFPPAAQPSRHAGRPYGSLRPEPEETKPTLVKHLQKIHGLTKKRTYGLQPTRQPFVRDESPENPYSKNPNPNGDAPGSSPTYTSPPRPLMQSRRSSGVTKRKNSDAQRRAKQSPPLFTTTVRDPRVSSPDSDSSTSSPTSVSPLSAISPVIAVPMHVDYHSSMASLGLKGGVDQLQALPASSGDMTPEVVYPSAPLTDTVTPIWHDEKPSPTSLGMNAMDVGMPPDPVVLGHISHNRNYNENITSAPNHINDDAQRHPRQAAMVSSQNSPDEVPLPPPDFPPPNRPPYPATAYPSTRDSFSRPQLQLAPNLLVAPPPPQVQTSPMSLHSNPHTQTLDDGDKPFIFYPEYEQTMSASEFHSSPAVDYQATQPYPPPPQPPPSHASYSASWPAPQSTDYSHMLNPAVSPGMLRSIPLSHPPAQVYGYQYGVGGPAAAYMNFAPMQQPAVQTWTGYS